MLASEELLTSFSIMIGPKGSEHQLSQLAKQPGYLQHRDYSSLNFESLYLAQVLVSGEHAESGDEEVCVCLADPELKTYGERIYACMPMEIRPSN